MLCPSPPTQHLSTIFMCPSFCFIYCLKYFLNIFLFYFILTFLTLTKFQLLVSLSVSKFIFFSFYFIYLFLQTTNYNVWSWDTKKAKGEMNRFISFTYFYKEQINICQEIEREMFFFGLRDRVLKNGVYFKSSLSFWMYKKCIYIFFLFSNSLFSECINWTVVHFM